MRVDLDDGDVGLGVDADDVGGTAVVGRVVGIGGELDVDLVGLVDDVVVGDDVAARVDDEAGAEGFALVAAGAVIAAIATLAAEEAVEEVLHVAGVCWLVIVAVVGLLAAAAGRGGGVCWRTAWAGSSVLMLTTAGPTCLAILEKSLDRVTGLGMMSGRASEESTVCSLPLTVRVRTEPARMPSESVASRAKVVVRRWLRMRFEQCGRSVISVYPFVGRNLILCVAMRWTVCAA